MKKHILTAIVLSGITIAGFSQAFKKNDKSSDMPVMPQSNAVPEKYVLDLKFKSTIDDKNIVFPNYTINFFQTAEYRVEGKTAGYKIKEKKSKIRIKGISDAAYQEITDVTYKHMVDKLKEIGYTINDISKLESSKSYVKNKDKVVPIAKYNAEYENTGRMVKSFTPNSNPVHPAISGNTFYYKIVKEIEASIANVGIGLDFISFGQNIGSETNMNTTEISWELLYQASMHGNVNLETMTPNLKYGSVGTSSNYRHEKTDYFTYTNESENGYAIVMADEAKYKQYAIEYINNNFDILVAHILSLKKK